MVSIGEITMSWKDEIKKGSSIYTTKQLLGILNNATESQTDEKIVLDRELVLQVMAELREMERLQ